jgi:hypothetical protein
MSSSCILYTLQVTLEEQWTSLLAYWEFTMFEMLAENLSSYEMDVIGYGKNIYIFYRK